MGVEYTLVNESKKECISFHNMQGSKAKELAGNPAQAAIVTWYLLKNQGDAVQLVSDSYDDWPFNSGDKKQLVEYKDVTSMYIQMLIDEGILKIDGKLYTDQDDPDNIYILNIKNIWLDNA